MNTENRKEHTERLTGWTENWALSFAFAITQSVELSEEIISQSMALLLTPTNAEQYLNSSRSTQATRFATAIWGLASQRAYRGFGADVFFKMPVIARAIVVLKIKALFSRDQIALVLEIPTYRIDDQLENARLLFSEGKNWITAVSSKNPTSALLSYGCTSWTEITSGKDYKTVSTLQASKDLQELFTKYLGNDLGIEAAQKLHAHLLGCESCRSQYVQFKSQYLGWVSTIPVVEMDSEMKQELEKITKISMNLKRSSNSLRPPSLWLSFSRMVTNSKTRAQLLALFLGIFTALVFTSILKK